MKRCCGLAALLIGLLFLSGCWNRRELNDLALVVAMSIDKAEQGYQVSVQVVEPAEIASRQSSTWRTPVAVYSETGEQIFETVRKMTKVTPRRLYFPHLQMLVLSEAVAKEGISKTLDFINRDNEFRKDFYVVISRNRPAREMLENVTALEKIPANKMNSSLQTSQKSWAPTLAVQLDDLIEGLSSDGGRQPVLTGLVLFGDESKSGTRENVDRTRAYAQLEYQDIAVFRKDKLVGWLNESESKGYNYITNHVKSTVGPINCPDGGRFGVEILHSKSHVKGKVVQGKPSVEVRLEIEVNIGEVACQVDITDPGTIRRMEEEVEKRNLEILEASVAKAKKLKSDIFGFGDAIHHSDPQAWKTLKKDWDEQFTNLEVKLMSDVKIRRTGTVNRSFTHKEEGK